MDARIGRALVAALWIGSIGNTTAQEALENVGHTFTAGEVRVVLDRQGPHWLDSYWAKDSRGSWHLILDAPSSPRVRALMVNTSGSALSIGRSGLFSAPPALALTQVAVAPDEKTSVALTGEADGYRFRKEIALTVDGRAHIRLTATLTTASASAPRIEYFLASHAFIPDSQALSAYQSLDLAYAPGLRPMQHQVIGDHMFRAPAAIAQVGTIGAALVPDLDSIKAHRVMPAIIDLDAENAVVDAPLLSYGFCGYDLTTHVYFRHDPGQRSRASREMIIEYDLLLSADAAPPRDHAAVAANPDSSLLVWTARYLWERYGTEYFKSVLPQALPFAEYAKACYPAAFAEKAGDVQLGWWEDELEGRPVGGVYAGWGYQQGNTSWQAWFNNLRSAYGMHWWGQRLGNSDWIAKSERMLNMALAAPQDDGAFPTTYNNWKKEWEGALITRGGYYNSVDMAWKCYWMLRWHQDFEARPEVLDYCRRLGDFFVKRQEPSGAIPSWFTKDFKPVEDLRESAQTSLPGWFLAELYGITKDAKYLEAARKAGDFLAAEVVPLMAYYDFETFFSCSPKELIDGGQDHEAMRDPHTRQLPQNTLSMQWCAELGKRLFELTNENKYLGMGQQALDAFVLYQNVWPISFRRVANTYGGFGVQSSDGEYNDARQSQFGATLCDYGALLGRKDYFERGVAALRASMTLINHPAHITNAIYPEPNYPFGLQPENTGHGGEDEHNGRTGFDWGEGSGLAGIAYVMNRYGGAYIDPEHGWAVGIDGVRARMEDDQVTVTNGLAALPSPYEGQVEVVPVVASGTRDEQLVINGEPFQPGEPIKPPSAPRVDAFADVPVNPRWDFARGDLQSWVMTGTFADIPSDSRRTNFGRGVTWFLGTGEDGEGGWKDEQTGEIYSPVFRTTCDKIRLKVGGGKSPGTNVSLVRADTQQVVYTEHGEDREELQERTWDVSGLKGIPLFIRVRDHERGAWGHINVADIRCE